MLILSNLNKVNLRNWTAICFVLVCLVCFISQIAAQPTSFRNFSPNQRKGMTQGFLEDVEKLTRRIEKDNQNIAFYKERLQFYKNLLELNFDNSDWLVYADKLEADLSRIIELEETADNYVWRGNWFSERLRRSPPSEKISELYPINKYFDKAVSDYLKASRLNSEPQKLTSIYNNLSELYSLRPQKLVLSADFRTGQSEIPLKLVLNDFDASIRYRREAFESGYKLPYADLLKTSLAGTYKTNADTAFELGEYKTALNFYEAGQNYLGGEYSQCPYYAAWGNVYLKMKKFDKAIELFNTVPKDDAANCVILFGNRGDAFAAKGDFERSLSEYRKALALDQGDSLKRSGWLYIKRSKLFLKLGKPEEALADLNLAIEKQYIFDCPQVYEIRAEAYRKLGKLAQALSDKQTANKLKNQQDCSLR